MKCSFGDSNLKVIRSDGLGDFLTIFDDISPALFSSGFSINRHCLFSLELLKTPRLTCHARMVFTDRSKKS